MSKSKNIYKALKAFFAGRWPLILIVVCTYLVWQANVQSPVAAAEQGQQGTGRVSASVQNIPSAQSKVFLPFARGGVTPVPVAQPMLIGVYSSAYMGVQGNIDSYLKGLDTWAGLSHPNKGHSIAGDFLDFEDANPGYNIPVPAELLWSNGYTKFINITTGHTAAYIAGGSLDTAIGNWADAYKTWTDNGGGRKAFLAPMPEMNGDWTPYGCHPADFVAAYLHIQTVFARHNVTRSKVWWVFAPNGWSSPCAQMSQYYPGDAAVDVIGFSGYNQSYATAWQGPATVYGPYIDIIRTQVSANRPIFVAQTGSCSVGGDKDQWLRDTYLYLSQQAVRGIIYFNIDKECDWAVYQPSGRKLLGYKEAVTAPNVTRYLSPATLSGTVLPP